MTKIFEKIIVRMIILLYVVLFLFACKKESENNIYEYKYKGFKDFEGFDYEAYMKKLDNGEDVYIPLDNEGVRYKNLDLNKINLINDEIVNNKLLDDENCIGNYVKFGIYNELYYGAKGKTAVLYWKILDEQNGKLLLHLYDNISEEKIYNIDSLKFSEPITWENNSARIFLNDVFYNNSFTESEKECICDADFDGVKDRVFVLNISEMQKYYKKIEERPFQSYLRENSIQVYANKKHSRVYTYQAKTALGGYIDNTRSDNCGICPAIWVDKMKIFNLIKNVKERHIDKNTSVNKKVNEDSWAIYGREKYRDPIDFGRYCIDENAIYKLVDDRGKPYYISKTGKVLDADEIEEILLKNETAVFIKNIPFAYQIYVKNDKEYFTDSIGRMYLINGDVTKAKVGETIKFGHFDNNGDSEKIEIIDDDNIYWRVINKDTDGNITLMSEKEYIWNKNFHHMNKDKVCYRDSYRRKWLNDEFYNTAFNEEEKSKLVKGKINLYNFWGDDLGKPSDKEKNSNLFDYVYTVSNAGNVMDGLPKYLLERRYHSEEIFHSTNITCNYISPCEYGKIRPYIVINLNKVPDDKTEEYDDKTIEYIDNSDENVNDNEIFDDLDYTDDVYFFDESINQKRDPLGEIYDVYKPGNDTIDYKSPVSYDDYSDLNQLNKKMDEKKKIDEYYNEINARNKQEQREITENNVNIIEKFSSLNKIASIKKLFKDIKNAKTVVEYNFSKEVKDMDTVKFGKYEQDGDLDNGKEDIEWIVVKKKDGKALLLSKYIIEAKNFHNNENEKNIIWKNSSIRKWLNDDFYINAFGEGREAIEKVNLSNKHQMCPDSMKKFTELSFFGDEEELDDTEDFVFLLSVNECQDNFNNGVVTSAKNKRLATKPTDYAKYTTSENGKTLDLYSAIDWNKDFSNFYLRTSGYIKDTVSIVFNDGSCDGFAIDLYAKQSQLAGIRPAIWVRYDVN